MEETILVWFNNTKVITSHHNLVVKAAHQQSMAIPGSPVVVVCGTHFPSPNGVKISLF